MDIEIKGVLLDMASSKISEENFYLLIENEIKYFAGTENIKNI